MVGLDEVVPLAGLVELEVPLEFDGLVPLLGLDVLEAPELLETTVLLTTDVTLEEVSLRDYNLLPPVVALLTVPLTA